MLKRNYDTKTKLQWCSLSKCYCDPVRRSAKTPWDCFSQPTHCDNHKLQTACRLAATVQLGNGVQVSRSGGLLRTTGIKALHVFGMPESGHKMTQRSYVDVDTLHNVNAIDGLSSLGHSE